MSVIKDCERCGENRPIKWVIFSDILTDYVCETCGEDALKIKRIQTNTDPYPGRLWVVSYERSNDLS